VKEERCCCCCDWYCWFRGGRKGPGWLGEEAEKCCGDPEGGIESAGMELFFMDETILAGEVSGDKGTTEAVAKGCGLLLLLPFVPDDDEEGRGAEAGEGCV